MDFFQKIFLNLFDFSTWNKLIPLWIGNFWLASVGMLLASIIFLSFHICGPIIKLYRTGLPFPRPVYPFFGNFYTVYRRGFHGAQMIWHRSLGKCYAVAQAQTVVIAVSDPGLLKQILVKNFPNFINRRAFPINLRIFRHTLFISRDEEWKWARRIIIPTFTSHKIKSHMFPLMMQCAERHVGHLKYKLADNPKVDISTKDLFGCFTMDVIASTAFGLDLDSYGDKNNIFTRNAKKSFEFEATKPIFLFLTLFPGIFKLLSYINYDLTDPVPVEFFAEVIKETITKRRNLNIQRNDYLQLLIEANDAYNTASDKVKKYKLNGNTLNGGPNFVSKDTNVAINDGKQKDYHNEMSMTELENEGDLNTPANRFGKKQRLASSDSEAINPRAVGFSEDEVIGNAILFFLAGYESTANSLCYIARMLAWYPDVQDRVKEELNAKIRQRTNTISNSNATALTGYQHLTYEDVLDLPYMDCVIKEVLRLHPPILIFDRMATEDITLDETQFFPTRKEGFGMHSVEGRKFFIKKGTIIEIPVYALHRDEDLWSDPDTFNPSRFMNDRGDKGIDYQYQYMPFGYGPRNCVGLRFALLEIRVGLAAILGSGLKYVPALGDSHKDLTPENTKFKIAGLNFPRAGIFVGITNDDKI